MVHSGNCYMLCQTYCFVMSYYTFSPINSVQKKMCYLACSFTRVRNITNQKKNTNITELSSEVFYLQELI